MQPKHTDGPWVIDGPKHMDINGRIHRIVDGSRYPAAFVPAWDNPGPGEIDGKEESLANARLIAAAPELLEAQTMGASLNTPDFLDWIADRLIHVYHEPENIDFVLSLRDRAKRGRTAIAKATGSSDAA